MYHLKGGSNPGSKAVAISGGEVTSAGFPIGYTCTPGSGLQPGAYLFLCAITGNTVNIWLNDGELGKLQPGARETTTLTVNTSAGSIAVNITLDVVGGSGLGATFVPSKTSVSLRPNSLGVRDVIILTPVPGQPVAVTSVVYTPPYTNWLSWELPDTQTPATLKLLLNSALLPIGLTQTAVVNLNIAGTPYQYTVELTRSSGITFSENPVSFTHAPGGPANRRTVTAYAPSATTIAAVSGLPCLLVDGGSNSGPKPTAASGDTHFASFEISYNPHGVIGDACAGTMNFSSGDGNTGFLTVNVNASGVGPLSLSMGALYFTWPGGATHQEVVASTSSASDTTIAPWVPQGSGWLSVSPFTKVINSGAAGTFVVTVTPAALSAGLHTGEIVFTAAGGITDTKTVPVTLLVSGGTGAAGNVNPAQLNFAAQAGSGNVPFPQSIAVTGVVGADYTASFTPAIGGQWLSVANPGGRLPAQVRVDVNPAGLSAGAYTGTITVSTSQGALSVPVTLTVTAASTPVIRANPGTLHAEAAPHSSATVVRNIDISSSQPGSEFAFSVSASKPWILLSTTSGSTPNGGLLQVTLDARDLATGTYSETITISAPGAGNPTLSIPVVFVVGGGGTGIATPGSLAFSGPLGATLPSQTVFVSGATGASFTTTTSHPWILLTPSSGVVPGSFRVAVNTSSLPLGASSGSITVNSGGFRTQTLPVTVSLYQGGSVALNPPSLSFDYQQGDAAPAAQTVGVSSTPAGVSFTAAVSSATPWLTVTPASGTTPGATLSVGVNPAGLSPGNHTGRITVTPAAGTPVTLNVSLQVRPPGRITVNRDVLQFTYRTGSAMPGAQTVQVGATGSPLGFTVSTTSSWIRITPTTGATPASVSIAVDPSALTPGSYAGSVTFASTGATPSRETISVTLSVTGPIPTITRVSNSASYVGNAIAPGEIVLVQGAALGPDQLVVAAPSGGAYPTSVADTRVLFNGIPGAIVYTRADQVAAVVPFSIGARAEVGVQAQYMGQGSNVVTMPLVPAMPGIFTLQASGTGPGAILNQDYSVNGAGNGAAAGSVIAIYATGGGQTDPASEDNAVATGAARTVLPVQVFIGGREVEVVYAGAAPQLVNGALQVNARIPSGLPAGEHGVVLRINNIESAPGVTVVVR